jgi:hypothetical protein
MALNYISVKGYIRNGKLHLELPDNVEDDDVEGIIPVRKIAPTGLTNSEAITLDENGSLEEQGKFLTPYSSTVGEILDYVLANAGDELAHIKDEVAWIEEQRRMEEENRSSWMSS